MAYDFSIEKYSETAPIGAPERGITPDDRASLYDIARDVIAGEYGNRVNIRQDDNSPISYDSLAETRGGREILDQIKEIISHYPEGHFDHPSGLSSAWDTVFGELCDAYDVTVNDAAMEVHEQREDAIARAEYNVQYPKETPNENNDVDMPWYLKSTNGIEPSVREAFLNNIDGRSTEFNEATERMLAFRAEGKTEEGERELYRALLEKSDEYRAEHNLPPFEQKEIDFSVDNGQRYNTYDEYKVTGSVEMTETKNDNTFEGGSSMPFVETENKEYVDVNANDVVRTAADVFSEAYSKDEQAKHSIEEYVNGNISKSELISVLEQRTEIGNDVTSDKQDGTANNTTLDKESIYSQKFQEHSNWLTEDKGNVRMPRDVFRSYHSMGQVYNAYKSGTELNGKVPTVADVALSAVNFLQSNVLESVIVAAFRLAFDSFSNNDVEKNEKNETQDTVDKGSFKDTDVRDTVGVHDNGYINVREGNDDITQKRDDIRGISSEAGKYYGFDLTKEPDKRSTSDCVIFNGDKPLSFTNKDTAEKITIPSMRYVDLDGKRSVVDPFGKVVCDITGDNKNYLSGLDVSKNPKISEFLKSEAKNMNVSLEEVKSSISNTAREEHVENIASTFKVEANSLGTQVEVLRAQGQDISRSENIAELAGKVGTEVSGNEIIKETFESIKVEAKETADNIENRISTLENRITDLNSAAEAYNKASADLEAKERIAYKSESEAVGRTVELISPYKDFVDKNAGAIEKGSEYVSKTVEVVNDLRKDQIGNDSQKISIDRYDFQITDRFGYNDKGILSKEALEAQGDGDLSIKEKILAGIEQVNIDPSEVVDMSDKELADALHDPAVTDVNEFIEDAKEAVSLDPEAIETEEKLLLEEISGEKDEIVDSDAYVETSQDIYGGSEVLSVEEIEKQKADPVFGEEEDDDEHDEISSEENDNAQKEEMTASDEDEDDPQKEADIDVEDIAHEEDNINTEITPEIEEDLDIQTSSVVADEDSSNDVSLDADETDHYDMPLNDVDISETVPESIIAEANEEKNETETPYDEEIKSEISGTLSEIFGFRIESDEGRTAIEIDSPYLENCESKLESVYDRIDSQLTADNVDTLPQMFSEALVEAINNEIANNQALIDVVGYDSLGEYIQDMGAHIMENIAENYGTDFANAVDAGVSISISNNEIPEEFVPYVEGALEGSQFVEMVEIPLIISDNIAIDEEGTLFDTTSGDELSGFPTDEAAEEVIDNVNVSVEEYAPRVDFSYNDVSASEHDVDIDDLDSPVENSSQQDMFLDDDNEFNDFNEVDIDDNSFEFEDEFETDVDYTGNIDIDRPLESPEAPEANVDVESPEVSSNGEEDVDGILDFIFGD